MLVLDKNTDFAINCDIHSNLISILSNPKMVATTKEIIFYSSLQSKLNVIRCVFLLSCPHGLQVITIQFTNK